MMSTKPSTKILFVTIATISVLASLGISDPGFDLTIALNTSDVRGPIIPFWKSTGFCPPEPHQDAASFMLSPDMQQNLAYIGAVPFNGISQVRVHWLLDLVKVKSLLPEGPVYDFTLLDAFVALMHQNDLHLGFELMGNPSDIYTDMENRTQVYWWRDLVAQTALRYIKQYGISYVRQWNFETWNEPDCHDFDNLKMSVQGFLNYYDACSEGLKMADKSLTFGGPGDGCGTYMETKSSDYADALFNHSVRGTNFFTGETGIRLDFISLHEKGEGHGLRILELETAAMAYIKSKYPELQAKPFYNDEADPIVGWNKPLLWRSDATYGGLVVKVISQHQNILRSRKNPFIENYVLLSNDNGFLSYYPNQFTQRTLLARFQMNQTTPHYVTFVRKPVYMMMGLLALLGDRQLHVDISSDLGQPVTNTSDYGALASLHEPGRTANSSGRTANSSDSWQTTLLVYGASDPGSNASYADLNVYWYIIPPPDAISLKMMIYIVYNGGSNPYDVWAGVFNKTDFPTLKQFAWLREEEVPSGAIYDVPPVKGFVPIPPRFQVLEPHVILFHVCAQPLSPPEKVTGVRFINVTAGQVMVVWTDANIQTKCLLTYEVQLSQAGPQGPYTQVNTVKNINTIFIFETDSESKVQGHYRVRAVDYWNRGGDYSDPQLYSTHPGGR
ncbi:alpha-L-iduronidase-like isoform X2 [Physella acuta]|uniref:alpha-L-iduronidase-like isoform X2 n=1 Tax=Physella acuta TaxID=109671 RepID=UPI0027DCA019|nr:alpha-L-iduronidase-like isoform X2 [Physella acuta]